MPKPPGTYLFGVQNNKIRQNARDTPNAVATAKADEKRRFFERLDQFREPQLRDYQQSMKDLIQAIQKREPLTPDDKRRKALSEAVGQITKSLEKVKDLREIEGRLEQPARTVLRTPHAPPGADLLTLAICVTQILEIFLRLKRGTRPH
jgi:hypothetical protein